MAFRALAACGGTCAVLNSRRPREQQPAYPSLLFRPTLSFRRPVSCEEPVKAPTTSARSGLNLARAQSLQLPRSALIRKNEADINDEYELGENLGEGAYSNVISGKHKATGLTRAVKVIPKKMTHAEMFATEVQSLMELDHPHIVKILEYFENETDYYIVQEFCNGPDLVQHVVRQAVRTQSYVPEEDLSVIMRHVLKSIVACHEHNVIHRDIKLENFMITTEEMVVKMIDFGLAFHGTTGGKCEAEITSSDVGTYRYMAPEIFYKSYYNTSVDLWSLGVGFYTLLTLGMLLPDERDDVVKCLKSEGYVQGQIKKCKTLKERKLSKEARNLLNQLLAYDPAKRITAQEALNHPFIRKHAAKNLLSEKKSSDKHLMEKLEKFSKASRLKRIALLALAHLTSQQPFGGLPELRQVFRSMDTSGDGELSLEEVTLALKSQGTTPPEDLECIFVICDCAGTGSLKFNEFIACMFPEELITEQLCAAAFQLLDRCGQGVLGPEEIKALYIAGGMSVEGHGCESIVLEATGKTSITLAEFQHFIMNSK